MTIAAAAGEAAIAPISASAAATLPGQRNHSRHEYSPVEAVVSEAIVEVDRLLFPSLVHMLSYAVSGCCACASATNLVSMACARR